MTTEKKEQTQKQQQVYGGSNYYFDKSDNFGCCLIININKTMKTIGGGHSIQKFRTGAEAEVKKLQDVFGRSTYKTDVIKEEAGKNCVLSEIDKYIEGNCAKGGCLKTCRVFVCVVLAFGGPGFFYDSKGNRISLSTVVKKFQSCTALQLKPKLFVVQSCDIDLQPVGKHLFGDVEGRSVQPLARWPREADVLIYQSNISGEYDWHPDLIKHSSLKNQGTPALRSCTFIKYFCNSMKSLQDEIEKEEEKEKDPRKAETATIENMQNYIEFNEVILRTNIKLGKFIKDRMNWDLVDGTWSTVPRLPVVTDQLAKLLFLPCLYR
ncbi:uncharacterized protein LOC134256087 [Saccostrea cucullata]|uniref:uncharacterized protein LOC134256087 n=1 Tax=Saccostrea cuccullata TaxID=36930 RepID=UPI002ED2C329